MPWKFREIVGSAVEFATADWYWLWRSLPTANDVNATGIVGTPVRLPEKTTERPAVLPSLKMITPDAPAFWAFATFWLNVQVPRWMSAMRPATKPVKSEGSQPLVEPPVDGIL